MNDATNKPQARPMQAGGGPAQGKAHKFVCPNCRRTLNVPDTIIGQTGTCPGCHKAFKVELPKAVEEISLAAPTSSQPMSAGAVAPPPPDPLAFLSEQTASGAAGHIPPQQSQPRVGTERSIGVPDTRLSQNPPLKYVNIAICSLTLVLVIGLLVFYFFIRTDRMYGVWCCQQDQNTYIRFDGHGKYVKHGKAVGGGSYKLLEDNIVEIDIGVLSLHISAEIKHCPQGDCFDLLDTRYIRQTQVQLQPPEPRKADPKMFYTVKRIDEKTIQLTIYGTPNGDIKRDLDSHDEGTSHYKVRSRPFDDTSPWFEMDCVNGRITSVTWDGREVPSGDQQTPEEPKGHAKPAIPAE